MVMKKIAQGAEAIIYLDEKKIIKDRISKSYRHPILDKSIIKRRTKAEVKIMQKISKIINTPKPVSIGNNVNKNIKVKAKKPSNCNTNNWRVGKTKSKGESKITMPFIDGKKLSQYLDTFSLTKQKSIMQKIGKAIAKLHQKNIVHGDLTTSNMIYKSGKVYFIDFGLAFQNAKYEDKGVDVHLFKQALEAKHFKYWETLFQEFEKTYKKLEPKEALKVFKRLKAIEKRGRYRH